MSDITIIATCYGDYWDTFGEQWKASIAALDPQAAEVILVSDIPRPVPDGVRNIAIGEAHMTDYWMVGAMAAQTEWASLSGFDDVWMPDAMTPFNTDADVYGFPVVMTGMMSGLFAYAGGYEDILHVPHNPMLGDFFYRRSLLEDIPMRRVGYMDWCHFAEMRYFGRTFDAGGPPRAYKTRHPQAISLVHNPAFQWEVDDFKARLLAGQIEMGVA